MSLPTYLYFYLRDIIVVVHQGCWQAPDPYKPPYKMPDHALSLVPEFNITYMEEQTAQNLTTLKVGNDRLAAASSIALA